MAMVLPAQPSMEQQALMAATRKVPSHSQSHAKLKTSLGASKGILEERLWVGSSSDKKWAMA
ncbi:MAG: hypothetical protein D6691_04430 [Candidatus Hydrogenedentota bacterium]|jgi:hypothetical protein|nr:MAG: hypothetical protein D6691_04430 [Candidatus Hydrogenedentota bacterium]